MAHRHTDQAPLDEDLDLLLDERTGVKLLGLDAVVEDPSTDPAFDSYKVRGREQKRARGFLPPSFFLFLPMDSTRPILYIHARTYTHGHAQASIRRLLSLSTKLETLYLLLVPGGDPLQHRAAIRAISNAVLNCTRMVRAGGRSCLLSFVLPSPPHPPNSTHGQPKHKQHNTGGGRPRRLGGGPRRAPPPPARRRGRHAPAAGGAQDGLGRRVAAAGGGQVRGKGLEAVFSCAPWVARTSPTTHNNQYHPNTQHGAPRPGSLPRHLPYAQLLGRAAHGPPAPTPPAPRCARRLASHRLPHPPRVRI